jgi:hypothetical protein
MKKPTRPRDVTVLIAQPSIVRTSVDMEFLAQERPKFTIKGLVVFAMALGGRIHQRHYDREGNFLPSLSVEFEIPVSEAVPPKPKARRRP